ncbi:PAS-associated C-terminal [Penicillium paradoxum]|uniref:PAS-associated C-terminal n=1 Tax=Penicillium paradoxum TaxID=176176 RepID=UPI002547DAA9|nr:PAS-associated C-terminal [Penicillium paradoxum]KAJ5780798.1 PAS-associated C-terminal [Penicillium paradoxum]
MESPSIPDHRPQKRSPARSGAIVESHDFERHFNHSTWTSVRSDSPQQTYESPTFGQPAIGRPPMGLPQPSMPLKPNANGLSNGVNNREPVDKPSIDQESVAGSIATLDLGYHSIGQPQSRREKHSSSSTGQVCDQRSFSNLSFDQHSIETQSLGHHSIGGSPGRYFLSPSSSTRDLRSSASNRSLWRNSVINELPILQQTNPNEGSEQFHPIIEENEEASFDLVAPYNGDKVPLHTLEQQADLMFCSDHMLAILSNPRYLARFREFLAQERPGSISTLTYYLNASKSLKAIQYANALVRLSVDVPTAGIETAEYPVGPTINIALEQRVQAALDALTAEELPAFITSTCIKITGKVVEERIRGTLPAKFQGTSDGLAEVFCLTDPSRPDNPIIFASEEFHRTTQYGMEYVLGRNCRFLQGPKTNSNSVRRIREALKARRHHSELFLNYRRDGSPFMNLLQIAPLCDSRGRIRYFIGAQIDVSGLAMEGAQMESLQKMQTLKTDADAYSQLKKEPKSEFQELGELLSPRELQNVRQHGGSLFQPTINENPHHRLFLQDSDTESEVHVPLQGYPSPASDPASNLSLSGVYKNYLLVRPYPHLRILFTSPSLQIPGILQSSFLNRIGETGAKRDDIINAMKAGRSVTARIRWLTKYNDHGRNRWVHCTPLLANNGKVGVWMVIVVDDDEEESVRWQGNWPTI